MYTCLRWYYRSLKTAWRLKQCVLYLYCSTLVLSVLKPGK